MAELQNLANQPTNPWLREQVACGLQSQISESSFLNNTFVFSSRNQTWGLAQSNKCSTTKLHPTPLVLFLISKNLEIPHGLLSQRLAHKLSFYEVWGFHSNFSISMAGSARWFWPPWPSLLLQAHSPLLSQYIATIFTPTMLAVEFLWTLCIILI